VTRLYGRAADPASRIACIMYSIMSRSFVVNDNIRRTLQELYQSRDVVDVMRFYANLLQ